MKHVKKTFLLSLAIVIGLSITGCSNTPTKATNPEEVQEKFRTFVDGQTKEAIKGSYTNMQQLISDPSAYGIDRSEVAVQIDKPWSEENEEESIKQFEADKAEFETFNRDDLTQEQQLTYDILADQIEQTELSLKEEYRYLGNVFNLFTGIHTQVPTFLVDFQFYIEQDVKDIVTLTESVKPLFDSYKEYMIKQKEAGTFMSDYNVDEVVEYCDKLINQGSGTDMLNKVKANIDAFTGIDDAKKETYKQQLEDAYNNALIPAYQEIMDVLPTLKSSENNQLGLSHLKNGKKAYEEVYYRSYTGSDLTIKEAISMLETKMDNAITDMQKSMMANKEVMQKVLAEDFTAGFDSYESMLENLALWTKEHYNAIEMPEYEAVAASDLVSDGVGAYYVVPFIDKSTTNLIRVNTSSAGEINSLQTYYYVAHEGFPGHMYYYNYLIQNIKEPYLIINANYLGFSEGYANYGASYALQSSKAGEGMNAIMKANFDINWAISARIDIGINYEGWTLEELKTFLNKYNLGDAATEELYNSTQSSPGSSLSYGVGYFEICDMRTDAEKQLGDKFNEKDFNDALIKAGNAPFSMVKANVEAYIKEAK